MQEALEEAKKAYALGEVPIGAVLVFQGKVIARAHNCTEKTNNASCHAELLCLQEGARLLGNWRLNGATLFSTLEPCPMCAGAMIHFRLGTLIYGALDLRCGAVKSWMPILQTSHPIHQVQIEGGVLADESATLMRNFFKERRLEEYARNI